MLGCLGVTVSLEVEPTKLNALNMSLVTHYLCTRDEWRKQCPDPLATLYSLLTFYNSLNVYAGMFVTFSLKTQPLYSNKIKRPKYIVYILYCIVVISVVKHLLIMHWFHWFVHGHMVPCESLYAVNCELRFKKEELSHFIRLLLLTAHCIGPFNSPTHSHWGPFTTVQGHLKALYDKG